MSAMPPQVAVPSAPFLRVVAIGVQGLTSSRPQSSPEALLHLGDDQGGYVIWTSRTNLRDPKAPPGSLHIIERVAFSRTKDESLRETFDWIFFGYDPRNRRWWRRPDAGIATLPDFGLGATIPERDVEREVALLYTRPFPITHVSDASLALARKIIRRCEGDRS